MQNPKIQNIKIADIKVDFDNRRRVNPATVADIDASVQDIGMMTDPILLRRARRKSGDYLILLDGAHRLQAARGMGWGEIPARVFTDINDATAKLIEFDANQARFDLTPLEMGICLLERKEIYEQLHPETKRGAAGSRAAASAEQKENIQTDKMSVWSFSKSSAEKLEISERQVYRLVQVVSSFSTDELKDLRRVTIKLKFTDLQAISQVTDSDKRNVVIKCLLVGEPLAAALEIAGLSAANKPESKVYTSVQMGGFWSRTPMADKRRFVSENAAEIRTILNSDLSGDK